MNDVKIDQAKSECVKATLVVANARGTLDQVQKSRNLLIDQFVELGFTRDIAASLFEACLHRASQWVLQCEGDHAQAQAHLRRLESDPDAAPSP